MLSRRQLQGFVILRCSKDAKIDGTRISLGTAELPKEFFGFARAFLTQQNGFGLALWIADQAFFVQAIQRIPVVTFPRVNRSTL
jgi:hypothetical protein